MNRYTSYYIVPFEHFLNEVNLHRTEGYHQNGLYNFIVIVSTDLECQTIHVWIIHQPSSFEIAKDVLQFRADSFDVAGVDIYVLFADDIFYFGSFCQLADGEWY